ncbi:MAG: ATP-dependent DNA ligase [Acidimicrobiales bacterium]
MDLPVNPPVAPMLAKASRTLPVGEDLYYEPKWDGFRCIVFRDGAEVELGSRNERPLTRYFPELVRDLLAQLPSRCVIDGEIVIAGPGGLDFDALLQRIHPADSRVRHLAASTPASFVAFDLLALGDTDLRSSPFATRRRQLEQALASSSAPIHVTPATASASIAQDWFSRFEGAGLDGVVVKNGGLEYHEGKRLMTKVKHERTADCVVAGFRWHKSGGRIGSLLLGLYDDAGHLQHVGVTSSFTDARRLELVDELASYKVGPTGHPWTLNEESLSVADRDETAALDSRRVPGAPSRWNTGKDLSFEPLRPELVCEVSYDHLQARRFRHATSFRRWRPDRDPTSCRYDQLETIVPTELAEVFGSAG